MPLHSYVLTVLAANFNLLLTSMLESVQNLRLSANYHLPQSRRVSILAIPFSLLVVNCGALNQMNCFVVLYGSTVLVDTENVGVAFGISLLSCIYTEILRCFISTSGYCQSSLIYDSG